MSRLTPFSRILIALALVAGVYFGARQFLPGLMKKSGSDSTTTTETTVDNRNTDDNASAGASDNGSTSSFNTTFNYTPPAPSAGKMKGVVELGATGFNSFIIRIDGQKNWKLEKAEYGASLVYEKLATDEDIKNGLKNYIANMLGYGVGARDIHFVISSGAKKVDIIDKIISTLKGMGYFVNTVTAEQEAQYALKATLPKDFYKSGFVVDIGSGNTKISWINGNAITGLETYGAKYFQNGTTDNAVYQDVKSKAGSVPANLRKTCFIIGGVPYELAKQHRNNKERFTALKAPGDYKADGEKQRAGLNIYKAVADATGCNQFVFDWDSNFTIGFLLNL